MKLAITGATGRMGLSVARLAHAAGDQIVGASCGPNDPALGRDLGELIGVGSMGVSLTGDVSSALLSAEVVIDFSTAAAVPDLFGAASRQKVAVVSGTTNLGDPGERALSRAA